MSKKKHKIHTLFMCLGLVNYNLTARLSIADIPDMMRQEIIYNTAEYFVRCECTADRKMGFKI